MRISQRQHDTKDLRVPLGKEDKPSSRFSLRPGSFGPQPPRRVASEPLWKGPRAPRPESPVVTAGGASCLWSEGTSV